MSLGIIELNDSNIQLSQDDRQWSSPGYALATADEVLIGEAARQQARLMPLSAFNQFWHRLSLEATSSANHRVRHHADLAYFQLSDLAQQAGECDEVVLAVPGNFSADQLSLLLGIARECPFNAVGLVDCAVAALAPEVGQGRYLHVDIQLHQVVISEVEVDSEARLAKTEPVPEAGLETLYGHWARMISDQFIQQTRFDPLHTAEAEQQLYNHLSAWVAEAGEDQQLELAGHKIALTPPIAD